VANKDKDSQSSQRSLLPSINSKDVSRSIKKVEGATIKHARRFVFRRLDNFREARRHIALWILAIGVVIGATGLQFYWYQQEYRTEAFARDGIYAEGVEGPLESLNPLFARSSAEKSVSKLLFSTILRYDVKGEVNYDLAKNMTIEKDKRTYVIELRPDARWHDGLYVRARDVVFTVNLVKNTQTRAEISGWGGVKVEEVDPLTVKFTLPSVYAPFTQALTQLPILPEHILRDVAPGEIEENAFSNDPIGSGPFTLRTTQEVATDRRAVFLARNTEYYRQSATIERMQLHVYENNEALLNALKKGEVNAISDISIVEAQDLKGGRYEVSQHPINNGVYAILNTTSPLLKDVNLRRALQAATDTDSIRANLSDETPELYLPFIACQVTHGTLPSAPAYDTAKAAALFDKAGWKLVDGVRQKDGESLRLSVVTLKGDDLSRTLDSLVEQWRAVGVLVTTNVADPSDPAQNVAQDILQPRQYDVLIYQLAIGGDPDVYAYWHSSQASSGLNFANYQSEISDDALVSARDRLDKNIRDAKYVTFANQWLRDVPAIGLYQVTMQYAHTQNSHPNIDSVNLVTPTDRFVDVTHWAVGTRRVYQTP